MTPRVVSRKTLLFDDLTVKYHVEYGLDETLLLLGVVSVKGRFPHILEKQIENHSYALPLGGIITRFGCERVLLVLTGYSYDIAFSRGVFITDSFVKDIVHCLYPSLS